MGIRSLYLVAIALVSCASCETDHDDYIKNHSNDLIKITAAPAEIEADGVSEAQVKAILSPDADKKAIAFVTDNGRFTDSAQKANIEATFKNDSLYANVTLQSSLEIKDNVKVSASINGITQIASLRFIKAFPDSLQLESAVASIKSGFGSEVPLQAFLIRSQGIPSLHHLVNFKAIKDDDKILGEFRGIDAGGSNDKGIVNATYVLKDTLYTGPVRIIASTAKKTGITTDTLTIHILK